MSEVYKKAEELADLILESDPYKEVRQTQELVNDNAEVKKLVNAFNAAAAKIAEKEKSRQPIEPEEKQEFLRLREEVQAHELLKKLLAAQADYAMMMNRIHSILQSRLEQPAEE
ncbi:MAG: YlbF family regulator [Planctomycetes bacterium]|jgi:cell fate (sporulation/competence/biofilm development) regulator YlbF (YheA/YmcA/DUF963 family)|nr:YlbF family regulator [Planctomycetota bacterium]